MGVGYERDLVSDRPKGKLGSRDSHTQVIPWIDTKEHQAGCSGDLVSAARVTYWLAICGVAPHCHLVSSRVGGDQESAAPLGTGLGPKPWWRPGVSRPLFTFDPNVEQDLCRPECI